MIINISHTFFSSLVSAKACHWNTNQIFIHLMEDKRIIETFSHDRQIAFNELYAKYRKPLFAYAYSILKNVEDAEDVVQDRFLYLLDRPVSTWATIEDLRSYLFRTIYYACLHVIRDSGTVSKKDAVYKYYISSWHRNETAEVEKTLEMEDKSAVIQPMLSKLGKQCRRAIELVYLEGESYMDAANKMGISKDSLKTHLSLGKAYFRKRIDTLINLTIIITFTII